MNINFRHYLTVTAAYWAFTLTDGAIRMLVILYFHQLGYSPLEVAALFVFYEFFGIITNMLGGWLAARIGLNVTLQLGMVLQVAALLMLTVPEAWLSILYVMGAQALSGIAKDLNKMSAKASVKTLLSHGNKDADHADDARLFKWVALLTGSKNTLKGVGFFLGAVLLALLGFQMALWSLAGGLFSVFLVTAYLLPPALGKSKTKPKFTQIFSHSAAINWLSAARFFLFGARDIWFVVALPVFLYEVLGWSFTQTGSFMAVWIIVYGLIQASAPQLLGIKHRAPEAKVLRRWGFILILIPIGIALALTYTAWDKDLILITGLFIFALVFALNSALHSYLILAYADQDKVALKVGFYYMSNAGGRLAGTLLSGWGYQQYGLAGCLWLSASFVLMAFLLALPLAAKQP